MKLLKKAVLGLLTVFGNAGGAMGTEIVVGSEIPKIVGVNELNEKVELGPLMEAGLVFVYFYPKADTPGCTKQACSLRDAYAKLQDKKVVTFGVSTDSVEAQKKFREKYRLPFHLIADTDKVWAKAFTVPVTLGFTSRQAFLMKKGKVVWLDRTASTDEQAADVLKAIEEHGAGN